MFRGEIFIRLKFGPLERGRRYKEGVFCSYSAVVASASAFTCFSGVAYPLAMRFFTLFAVIAVAVSAVVAKPLTVDLDITSVLEVDLSDENRYGAPNAPWSANARPGWYYGIHPERYPHLRCLRGVRKHRT
jgi:hypothetical protein